MSRYAKAIGAAVATLAMFILFDKGDVEAVETAIATIVTTFTVYLLPNRGAGA